MTAITSLRAEARLGIGNFKQNARKVLSQTAEIRHGWRTAGAEIKASARQASDQISAMASQTRAAGQKIKQSLETAGASAQGMTQVVKASAARMGSEIKLLSGDVQSIGVAWGAAARAVDKSVNRIGLALGLLGGAVTKMGISFNATAEDAKRAFTGLLGDAEKAQNLFGDLVQFGKETPFELRGLLETSKKLLAFGFEAKKIIPTLRTIGDATSQLGAGQEGIDRIVRALSQMRAKGKLQAEEMLQLAEVGVNGFQLIADQMGITQAEVQDLSKRGLIEGSAAVEMILAGLDQKFGGAMERAEGSFNQTLANLKDQAQQSAGVVFEPLFEALRNGMVSLTRFTGTPEFAGLIAKARDSVAQLVESAREMLPAFLNAGKAVWEFLEPILQWIQEHPQIAKALAIWKASQLIGAATGVTQLGRAIGLTLMTALRSLRGAIAATGIGLLVVGLGELIIHFDEIKAWFTSNAGLFGNFLGSMKESWDEISGAVLEAAQAIWTELEPVLTELADVFTNDIAPMLGEIVKLLAKEFVSAVKVLAPLVSDVLVVSIDNFKTAMETILPVLRPVVEFLSGQFTTAVETLTLAWDAFRIAFEKTVEFITGKNIGAEASDALSGMQGGEGESAGKGGGVVRSGVMGAVTGPLGFLLSRRGGGSSEAMEGSGNAVGGMAAAIQRGRHKPIVDDGLNQGGGVKPAAHPSEPEPSVNFQERLAQQAAQQAAQKSADAIAKAIAQSEMQAADRETPGFSNFRNILGMEGITPAQVTQLVGNQEGVDQGMAQAAGELFAQNQTPQFLDALAFSLANVTNEIQRQKTAQEKSQPIISEYANLIQDLQQKGTLSKEALNRLSNQALALRDQVLNGKISLDDFSQGMQNLTAATNQAVEAAKAKAAAEQREALLKGDFKGAGLDMQKALEDRLAQFRMSQFNRQVDFAWQRFARLNGLMPNVNQGFQNLRQGMEGFRDKLRQSADAMKQQAQAVDPQQAAQAWSRISAFMSSKDGVIASVRNQIQLLQQTLPLVDRARQRVQIENQIGQLMARLNELLRPTTPIVTGASDLYGIFRDPGLIGGNPTTASGTSKSPFIGQVSFNTLTRLSPEDQRQIVDGFEAELARRGYRS